VKAAAAVLLLAGPALAQTDRAERLSERARQDREIVYFLQAPETHAFDLYHDFTETKEGADRYVNVVREGSTVSNPRAIALDTGEVLKVETLKGEAIAKAGIDTGGALRPDSEAVVVRYPKIEKGRSLRIRILETYTDPGRYRLEEGQLVFDRGLGRPRNAIVLPAGYSLTNCSVPAMVSETEGGRVRLDFVNPRNDEIAVLLTARLRARPPAR
jgi:hypothetical protein